VSPGGIDESVFLIQIGQPGLAFISLLLVKGKNDVSVIALPSLGELNFVFPKVSKVFFGFCRRRCTQTFLILESPLFAYVGSDPVPMFKFRHGLEANSLLHIVLLEGFNDGGDEFFEETILL